MRVVCAPKGAKVSGSVDLRFQLYGGSASSPLAGVVGHRILSVVSHLEMAPAPRAWDLLSIALSVIAADESCSRSTTGDGWTRDIELTVAVNAPDFWTEHKTALQEALRFLTTDRWTLAFIGNGILPKPPKRPCERPEDSVCLLSGGLDSLVGSLDLKAIGRTPLLVSQVAKGNKDLQKEFARTIGENLLHLQLNHDASPPPGFSERSQRARSLVFIAYGVLAATCLDRYRDSARVELCIPENGFISLNVPLTPLRLASHSTRTTHPYFISLMQNVLASADLRVDLTNPYQFLTKGEMLVKCKDQDSLKIHAPESTSCGRFARNAFVHCGRCVPCLIRRAAFCYWGDDPTSHPYRYGDLSKPDPRHRDFDDVRSVAAAVITVESRGLDEWIGGTLNSAQLGDISGYRSVADRGLAELKSFMESAGVM
jgi:hypothetical protein